MVGLVSMSTMVGIQWVTPISIISLLRWWKVVSARKLGKVIWNLIPLAVVWSIWLLRNDYKFNDGRPNWESLCERVKCRIAFWAKLKDCGNFASVDDILFRLGSVQGLS